MSRRSTTGWLSRGRSPVALDEVLTAAYTLPGCQLHGCRFMGDQPTVSIAYDMRRFSVVTSYEMLQGGGIDVYDGRHRAPLVVHLSDNPSSQQWLLMHNHLARGNAEFRQQQARGLREWARRAELPIGRSS